MAIDRYDHLMPAGEAGAAARLDAYHDSKREALFTDGRVAGLATRPL